MRCERAKNVIRKVNTSRFLHRICILGVNIRVTSLSDNDDVCQKNTSQRTSNANLF